MRTVKLPLGGHWDHSQTLLRHCLTEILHSWGLGIQNTDTALSYTHIPYILCPVAVPVNSIVWWTTL